MRKNEKKTLDDWIEISEEEHVAMRSRRIEEKLIGFHSIRFYQQKKKEEET